MPLPQAQPELSPATIGQAVLDVLPGIEALYLFGSRAKGIARADSDLDLAVFAATPLDAMQRFNAQRALSAKLDCDVDLVDLHDASSVLRSEVVNHGHLLYRRDAERTLDFEARVLGEYAELLDATRELRGEIHRRGSVHA